LVKTTEFIPSLNPNFSIATAKIGLKTDEHRKVPIELSLKDLELDMLLLQTTN
jgi:hypothetical protein